MKRLPVALALAVAAVAWAGPAVAHEEITPGTVPTGRPAFLIFSAANERQVAATSVTLTAPAGLTLGSVTKEPAGWTVERAGGAVTWSGGTVAAGKFEQWGIELEEPAQPGAFTFRSTLRFADGRTDTHDVVLTVAQGAAAPTQSPPQVTTTAVAPTAVAPTTVAAGATEAVAGADGDDGEAEGRANLAIAMSGTGLLLAVVAVAMAARRPAPHGAAGGAAAGKEQEW